MSATATEDNQGRFLARASETLLVTFALFLFVPGTVIQILESPLFIGILQGWLTKQKNFFTTLLIAVISVALLMFLVTRLSAELGLSVSLHDLLEPRELMLWGYILVALIIGDYIGRFIRRLIRKLVAKTESDENIGSQEGGEHAPLEVMEGSTHDQRISLINRYLKAIEPALPHVVAIIAAVLAFLGSDG